MAGADFNLLAEINVQLAKNAAAQLKAAIDKIDVGTKSVKVTGSFEGELAKLFPGGGKLSTIRVGFDISDTQKNKIKNLVKDRKVKIDFAFSDKSEKGMERFGKAVEKLRLELEKLGPDGPSKFFASAEKAKKAFEDIKTVTSSERKSNKFNKDIRLFENYITRVEELKKANDKLGPDRKGQFVDVVDEQIKTLLNQFQTATKQLRKDAKKRVAEGFQGVNVASVRNAQKAFQLYFASIKGISREAQKASSAGIFDFDPSLLNSLKTAREDAAGLLKSLDAADPIALKARLDEITGTLKSQINDAKEYRALLRGLGKEKSGAQLGGADQQTLDAIQQRIDIAKNLRSQGQSAQQIKNNQAFQIGEDEIRNIINLDKGFKGLLARVSRLKTEGDLSTIFGSTGAKALGIDSKVDQAIRDTVDNLKQIKNTGAPDAALKIKEQFDRLSITFSNFKGEIKSLNKILDSLDTKEIEYDTRGLNNALDSTRALKTEVLRLAGAGSNINDITNAFAKQNQQIESLADSEKILKRYTYAVDRLRASLQSSLAGIDSDPAGVGVLLDNLDTKFANQLKSGSGFDDRELRKTLSEETYRIRAKNKINKLVQESTDKIDRQIFENGGSAYAGVQQAFIKAKDSWVEIVRAMDLSDNTFEGINKNLDSVKKKFDIVFDRALIESIGGKWGALAKAVGLATKRLTSFIVAALPLYTLQSTIFQLIGSVGKLDTEFIKLEQIFAGDSLVTANERAKALSSTILQLGTNYGVATEEIAQSADILAQANIRGKDLESILQTVTKARLGPTFGNASEITEAVIASLNQFELQASDVESVIGGINQVSAQYAVEADGITKAIRRAGGAFAAAKADGQSYKDALGEFVGAFTILKQETREADETLATSLRNILNRIQRSSIQKYLKDKFDINLLDANRQFIGFLPAIEKVTAAIQEMNIKSGDPRFAELVQKLAGSLQSSRLTSLLQDASQIRNAVVDFQSGGESLNRDVDIAFGSIENKLLRAKNAVLELFTEIGRSDAVKALIDLFTILVKTVTSAVGQIGKFVGSLGEIGTIASIYLGGKFLSGYLSKIGPTVLRSIKQGLGAPKVFGDYTAAATGGIVPGIGPNIDTEPYMLAKGEYVVNKFSVLKYGKGFFDALNSGKIKKAADGSGPNGLSTLDLIRSQGPVKSGVDLSVKELTKELRKAGISINNLGKYVNSFVTKSFDNSNVRGSYNSSNKTIALSDKLGSKGRLATGLHEIGHGVGDSLDSRIREELLSSIPSRIAARTGARVARNPSSYPNPASQLPKELFADAFRDAALSVASGGKIPKDLQDFAAKLKSAGVGINNRGMTISAAINAKNSRNQETGFSYLSQTSSPPAFRGMPPFFGGGKGGGSGFIPPASSGGPLGNSGAAGGIAKLISNTQALQFIIPALTFAVTAWISNSQEASKEAKNLSNALIAAIGTVITFSYVLSSITKIKASEKFKELFGGFGGGGGLKGLFGGSGSGGIGASLKSLFSKGGLKSALAGVVPKVASLAGTAVKGLGTAGLVGLQVFNQGRIDDSKTKLSTTISEAEVLAELEAQRKYGAANSSVGFASKVTGGAAIGSVIAPGIGTAIGGGIGALVGIFTDLSNSNIGQLVSSFLPSMEKVKNGTLAFFTSILDTASSFFSTIDNAVGKAANFLGLGKKASPNINKNETDLALAGANINAVQLQLKGKNGIGAASSQLIRSVSLLNNVKDRSAGDKDIRSKLTEQATRIKESLDVASPFEQAQIYEQAKKAGIDLGEFFKDLNIDFNRVAQTANLALNALNSALIRVQELSKNLSSTLDNVNAATEYYSQLAAGIAGEGSGTNIPSQLFDVLRNGGQVNGPAAGNLEAIFAKFAKFNSEAAFNTKTEFAGNQATRGLSLALSSGKIQIGGQGGFKGLEDALTGTFDEIVAGLPKDVGGRLSSMFDKYIESNEEKLTQLVSNGEFDSNEVSSVIDGFASFINKGAVDLFQKFSDSNNQFKQAYDGVIKKRIDYESKIIDLIRGSYDRQKALTEFDRKASGKFSDTSISYDEARNIDAKKQAALLYGTGLNGNASVADLRSRYGQLSVADPAGSNPEIQAMKSNIQKALEFIASGTDGFSTAMDKFDKASEKAKKSADELTGALLGTDESLISSLRGQLAYQKVIRANQNGGGILAVNQMTEEERSALNTFVNGDEQRKLNFQRSLGISPTVAASGEAKDVRGEFQKQTDANNALIAINQVAATNMNNLSQVMIANNTALLQLGNQINQFGAAANQMAQSLVNIPKNVTHTHTFNVSPIQVVFSGTNGLTGLNDATQKAVINIVNQQLAQFADSLQQNNKGLAVAPQPSQKSQPSNVGTGGRSVVHNR